MLKARSRRPRKLKPGEADFIVRQIAAQGDAIGFGPDGQVFILAALDRKRSVMAPDQALTAGFQFQGRRSARRLAG